MNEVIFRRSLISIFVIALFPQWLHADSVENLIESSCISCHDESTETRLDFTALNRDLKDPETFRTWVTIFDRISNGEMPPVSQPRPDLKTQASALRSLEKKLIETNRRKQLSDGRVASRRLSRREYQHTLHELLGIHGSIARYLPPGK